MAKLTTLKPLLAKMPPRLGVATGDEAARSKFRRDHAGHDLYNSRRWRGTDSKKGTDGLRWQVLADAMFTCAMCGKLEVMTCRLVADHIRPHRGDPALFFDRANLQCLCAVCHSSRKQAMERRGDI